MKKDPKQNLYIPFILPSVDGRLQMAFSVTICIEFIFFVFQPYKCSSGR